MEIKFICPSCLNSEIKYDAGVIQWQVASLMVEAFAWFAMLVLIGLETKQYVKEFRWYVRFGVVYVLVADAVLLDLVLPLKNSINRTALYLCISSRCCQVCQNMDTYKLAIHCSRNKSFRLYNGLRFHLFSVAGSFWNPSTCLHS
jgi:hypothetical protein